MTKGKRKANDTIEKRVSIRVQEQVNNVSSTLEGPSKVVTFAASPSSNMMVGEVTSLVSIVLQQTIF